MNIHGTGNPKAYQNWFKQLNERFVQAEKQRLIKKHDGRLFALNEGTVEKIPETQERSALQRVIQLVKYHADVYYTKGNIKKFKSASVIVTTLIALIAQDADASLKVFPLLNYIVGQLEIYGENLVDSWNQEPRKAQYFFQWIRILREYFLTSLETEDERFVAYGACFVCGIVCRFR